MEKLKKSLERCEDCRNDVIDCIIGVFQDYFYEKRQIVQADIDNGSLQIISTHKFNYGFPGLFREPVKSIICIFWHELEEDSKKRQSIINAIREYFDEDGDIGKKLEPFECCHNDVRPYVQRVLDRLFPEKRQIVQADIDNGSLQIISSHMNKENPYFTVKFSKPVNSIIYIDWEKLEKKTDDYKIYCIAHEIGHCYAGKGESGLWEKEANDWLRRWGNFDELIDKVKHNEPIDEEEGYIYGYNWANTMSEDRLWEWFSHYLILWRKESLNRRKEDEIISQLQAEILNLLESDDCNPDYLKGVALGIMKRVREISKEKN